MWMTAHDFQAATGAYLSGWDMIWRQGREYWLFDRASTYHGPYIEWVVWSYGQPFPQDKDPLYRGIVHYPSDHDRDRSWEQIMVDPTLYITSQMALRVLA